MMKYVVLIPQSFVSPNAASAKPLAWPQQPVVESPVAAFYPMHLSLEEEINRLLISNNRGGAKIWASNVKEGNGADVMEEFRLNGKDSEYLSEEEEIPKPQSRRRKNKKPLPTECVFCKNNGEVATFYRNHILKDAEGKVLCPILRNYECPICHAKGDNSHTLKYCPANPKPQSGSVINALKALRNATGKRRTKTGS